MAAATHGTINAPRMPIPGDDFGSPAVARELAHANTHVILVGRRNHHQRQPADTLTSPNPKGNPDAAHAGTGRDDYGCPLPWQDATNR